MPGAEKVGVTVCSSQAKPSEWKRWVSLDYSSAIHYPWHERYIVTFDLISIFFILQSLSSFLEPHGVLSIPLSHFCRYKCAPPLCAERRGCSGLSPLLSYCFLFSISHLGLIARFKWTLSSLNLATVFDTSISWRGLTLVFLFFLWLADVDYIHSLSY